MLWKCVLLKVWVLTVGLVLTGKFMPCTPPFFMQMVHAAPDCRQKMTDFLADWYICFYIRVIFVKIRQLLGLMLESLTEIKDGINNSAYCWNQAIKVHRSYSALMRRQSLRLDKGFRFVALSASLPLKALFFVSNLSRINMRLDRFVRLSIFEPASTVILWRNQNIYRVKCR